MQHFKLNASPDLYSQDEQQGSSRFPIKQKVTKSGCSKLQLKIYIEIINLIKLLINQSIN